MISIRLMKLKNLYDFMNDSSIIKLLDSINYGAKNIKYEIAISNKCKAIESKIANLDSQDSAYLMKIFKSCCGKLSTVMYGGVVVHNKPDGISISRQNYIGFMTVVDAYMQYAASMLCNVIPEALLRKTYMAKSGRISSHKITSSNGKPDIEYRIEDTDLNYTFTVTNSETREKLKYILEACVHQM